MEWTRSDTLALAAPHCSYCHGLGLKDGSEDRSEPCNCVLRNIFRACYDHFRLCVTQDRYVSTSRLERAGGARPHYTWGRKDEEYIADFGKVSHRALSETEYRIFKLHFLLGADWRLCCRQLNLDRGTFFHLIYRIESKLGRVFRELEPYCLYPLNEYFGGVIYRAGIIQCSPEAPPRRKRLRVPIGEPVHRAA